AFSLLERTLDDSANRRLFLPDGFLAIDECLDTTNNLIKDLVIFEDVIGENLQKYGIFSCTESLMMELVRKGANRQEIHELIREYSMQAWTQITKGKKNPLIDLLSSDKMVLKYISKENIRKLFNPKDHIGIARERTEKFLLKLKKK
ncbi:adenylosuccinate lyase, partial [Candidatus Roizmanbacteria bacterium]|nr:adenylosuccinate lyase [Candidatus Roizmanbacteria bacterium]